MNCIQIKCGDRIILRSKDEIIETQIRIIESQMKVIDILRKRIRELEIHEPLLPLIEIIPEIEETA
ncbi:MAG: hypothetical protein HWN67_11980 [Candidatus Helarchaeota archaeon]|nr:hypothetical protein [Candidatus Helarchaeota archaeon]